ncbi:MAG TPA: hypothetical protein DD388_07225 [Acidimicrobiaceae bacterium]|jgi:ABC-type Zn uptake system ZnuABC Zn-binding protein ZnuA|nr:hypothetical protein [Acidimicrobiaceae bacterium]
MRHLFSAILLSVLVTLFAGACGSSPQRAGILATTPLWAAITSEVACGHPVDSLIPVGADPHSFEPSLADRGQVDTTLLLVANGNNLEEGLDDIMSTTSTPVHYIINDAADDDSHNDDSDPHVWLDPLSVANSLPALADALSQHAGLDPVSVEACRRDLNARLQILDRDIGDRMATIPDDRRIVVTDHAMLGRFANRYHLRILGTVLNSHSSMAQASAHDLELLATEMHNQGVAVVAIEESGRNADSRRLAERTGATLVEIPLRLGPGGSATGSYEGMLRILAERLDDALRG